MGYRTAITVLVVILTVFHFPSPIKAGTKHLAAAALCVAKQTKCTEDMAMDSEVCLPYTFVKKQPSRCLKKACKYCQWKRSQRNNSCKSWAIRKWCASLSHSPQPSVSFSKLNPQRRPPDAGLDIDELPEPSTEAKETIKDPDSCEWKAENENVVINLAKVSPYGDWTRNGQGWIWKKGVSHGIDKPGSGETCFNFSVPSSGPYYMTTNSSAPHVTDYNDLWIKLSSGLSLYHARTNVFRSTKTAYLKGYQNEGKNKPSLFLSTVDHNPHIFVAKWLSNGETQTVCISGRSSNFTLYKIIFVKCSLVNDTCRRTSTHIKTEIRHLKDATCV